LILAGSGVKSGVNSSPRLSGISDISDLSVADLNDVGGCLASDYNDGGSVDDGCTRICDFSKVSHPAVNEAPVSGNKIVVHRDGSTESNKGSSKGSETILNDSVVRTDFVNKYTN